MKHKAIVMPGQGTAPKVRRGAGDPPEPHRCAECRKVRGDCVRVFHGRETEQWMCRPCLEGLGQERLPL